MRGGERRGGEGRGRSSGAETAEGKPTASMAAAYLQRDLAHSRVGVEAVDSTGGADEAREVVRAGGVRVAGDDDAVVEERLALLQRLDELGGVRVRVE